MDEFDWLGDMSNYGNYADDGASAASAAYPMVDAYTVPDTGSMVSASGTNTSPDYLASADAAAGLNTDYNSSDYAKLFEGTQSDMPKWLQTIVKNLQDRWEKDPGSMMITGVGALESLRRLMRGPEASPEFRGVQATFNSASQRPYYGANTGAPIAAPVERPASSFITAPPSRAGALSQIPIKR